MLIVCSDTRPLINFQPSDFQTRTTVPALVFDEVALNSLVSTEVQVLIFFHALLEMIFVIASTLRVQIVAQNHPNQNSQELTHVFAGFGSICIRYNILNENETLLSYEEPNPHPISTGTF